MIQYVLLIVLLSVAGFFVSTPVVGIATLLAVVFVAYVWTCTRRDPSGDGAIAAAFFTCVAAVGIAAVWIGPVAGMLSS